MTATTAQSSPAKTTLYLALELSNKTWKLGFQTSQVDCPKMLQTSVF